MTYENYPKSRKEAKALNRKHYFTGLKCNRGHVERRITSDGVCLKCKKENSTKYRKSSKGKNYFHNLKRTPEEIIFINAKTRANKKNLEFNMSVEDIKIPEKCPVFGIPIYRSKLYKTNNSPSLDRINPKLGYVKGNICIISDKANRLKSNMTVQEITKLLKYMEQNE